MLTVEQARTELLELVRRKSVFFGEFTLASGARSNFYFDCRLTTLDGKGATLVGQCMHALIRRAEMERKGRVEAVGGLTMGADPVALAVAMHSHQAGDNPPLHAFSVRKTPKGHGQGRLIEGNFKKGQTVVVVEDVITRGDSTLAAVNAVRNEGGTVAFVAVLVDRQEGGLQKVQEQGCPVFALFTKDELLVRT